MEVSTAPIFNEENNISSTNGLEIGENYSSDDDDIIRRHRQLKRNVTDSESDVENNDLKNTSPPKKITKSRIRQLSNSDSDSQEPTTASYKSSRVENRKMQLYDKFKALTSPHVESTADNSDADQSLHRLDNNTSERSDEEVSCLKIKKKLNKKKKNVLSSICDADTSDDDDVDRKLEKIKHQKKIKPKPLKSAIEIPPKMSAKQAMENMQKIKSESNRMLREKDVSLPYHKPRALSLQDIMNRKKPTLTSDGKVMPIKMNNEQLAQYAKLLEDRQKEIIELCKSDSEEEIENPVENTFEEAKNVVDEKQDIDKSSDNLYDTIMQETNTSSMNIENGTHEILDDKKNSDEESQSKGVNIECNESEIPQNDNVDNKSDKAVAASDVSLNGSSLDNDSMTLKYLDSSTENVTLDVEHRKSDKNRYVEEICPHEIGNNEAKARTNTETLCQDSSNLDSQAISLNFDSEKTENDINKVDGTMNDICMDVSDIPSKDSVQKDKEFSDDDNSDFNLEDIDSIIENAEIIKDDSSLDTPKPTMPGMALTKPKLTGSPGMFIDLETGDQQPRLLTGVDLLKERYSYFTKLKTVEDVERNRQQKHKPGLQHLKLKHALEEQIAEQRSLEWEKRLAEEKQLKSEMTLEPEDDIEKIESKLEDEEMKESSSSEEEDLVEDDVEMKDAPRKSNPMIDDEAEESNEQSTNIVDSEQKEDGVEENSDDEKESDNSSSDESSSESDNETTEKPRKGRIIKAFEDSDDETNNEKENQQISEVSDTNKFPIKDGSEVLDDEIQLAQFNRSVSDDIFATQESQISSATNTQDAKIVDIPCTADLGSQTFSILDSTDFLITKDKTEHHHLDGTLSVTQLIDESKFDAFTKKASESLSQDILTSQPLCSQSQEIGDDIAALCTGKFYDNPFISQSQGTNSNLDQIPETNIEKDNNSQYPDSTKAEVEKLTKPEENQELDDLSEKVNLDTKETLDSQSKNNKPVEDGNLLKSILDELNEPEVEAPNKFFANKQEMQVKKRLIIDSDEEDGAEVSKEKRKKLKKRKPEKRALQISDDEEEEENLEEDDESEIEEDNIEQAVEYDSEENEIEVQAKPVKKKRMGEFFENEAELTSEDEWVGSGDEDEAGLDRMEREEGDNEVFHQGQLQRELGQIHMREVLDQDKREVRLLQELLFEDGDLGDGHRQRKFRWKNDGDGDDGTGMGDVDLADTQEEEFESEELWRKQRHERELFLRSMQENEEEKVNTTLNRSALIKANLNSSKTANKENSTKIDEVKPIEPKNTKDLPSPKKPFLILKQSYHGSLLARGQGALARLAALATPLAAEADAPRPKAATSAPGNFVFATLSQPDPEPKVTKRKAETKADTPRLLKKIKTDETQKMLKNSLFDHFTT